LIFERQRILSLQFDVRNNAERMVRLIFDDV
jgi:hypothetical protein